MIDTDALRKKVIDLAIQGKLTVQLPSDGDAETLYAQILDQKSQLIKEGKIKKDKALPDIAVDEIPFEAPKNWKWVRFGKLMWNRDSERIPVSVEDRKKLKKTYDYYGASGVIDKVEDYLFDTKLLLIGEDGANLLSRSTPIAFLAEGKYWVNNHAHVLDFYLYDYLDFVMYYINSISLVPYVTGAAQPKLNQDNMNKIPVPLAPISEQRRIVEKIEEVLAQIGIIDDLQAKYSNDLAILKSKIIDAVIRGKLTEQLPEDGDAEDLYVQILNQKSQLIKEGKIKKEKPLPDIAADEIPFEIPENWKWVRLGDISSKISSGNTPAGGKKSDAYVKEGFCFFREQNIYDDGIRDEGMVYISEELLNSRPNSTVLPKDILLNITGGSIGRCAIVPDDFSKGSINQHILIIRMIDERLRHYIHHCLCSPYMQRYIKGKSVGDKDGFSGGRCKNMLIPLPPINEQKRICEKTDLMLAQM